MSRNLLDLLGQPATDLEIDLLDVYRRVSALAGSADLPPCVEANLKHALAALWQIVTDLDLEYRPEVLGEGAD